jgi:hypothetical protein
MNPHSGEFYEIAGEKKPPEASEKSGNSTVSVYSLIV